MSKRCKKHEIRKIETGSSKWNPIDHRMFSEISKNWAGVQLESFETVIHFARNTRTQTGLSVEAYRVQHLYQKGIKVSDQELQQISLLRPGSLRHAAFFFSDHGDFTGDYDLVDKTMNTFEDCLSRVPFTLKPPKGLPVEPRVSETLVELLDISATVYELTGIEPDYTHFGKSLLPVLASERDQHRDAAFCEGGRLYEQDELYDLKKGPAGTA